jgi:CO dehydrogenase nickel-insertion accessory protein CooC1
MAKIHMVLQGKGGVGKSMIAATVIAQYKASKGQQPLCIDTDPVNATFEGLQGPERAPPEHHGRRRDQHPELRRPGRA